MKLQKQKVKKRYFSEEEQIHRKKSSDEVYSIKHVGSYVTNTYKRYFNSNHVYIYLIILIRCYCAFNVNSKNQIL